MRVIPVILLSIIMHIDKHFTLSSDLVGNCHLGFWYCVDFQCKNNFNRFSVFITWILIIYWSNRQIDLLLSTSTSISLTFGYNPAPNHIPDLNPNPLPLSLSVVARQKLEVFPGIAILFRFYWAIPVRLLYKKNIMRIPDLTPNVQSPKTIATFSVSIWLLFTVFFIIISYLLHGGFSCPSAKTIPFPENS